MLGDFTLTMDRAACASLGRGDVGKKALEPFAIKVQAVSTKLCPVDTGRLQSSITYEVTVDAKSAVAFIGSNVEYAIYVEFSQPYLRPALRAV